MNPVQQIGVFHDANGSMPATVAACETTMIEAENHVTRILNEQPFNAGVPTPLPRISTLCVLPRLPGIISVCIAGCAAPIPGRARG